MLTRQKIILALLDRAALPATRTAVVKLAFLLRRESLLRDDPSFYDFVPYKYGPFSFVLFRDLTDLEGCGFIGVEHDNVCLAPATASLRKGIIEELEEPTRAAIDQILGKYGNLRQKELIKDVYTRYPWYASRSELTDLVPGNVPTPFTAELAVYTAGYEGRSVDSFFGNLLRRGIVGLIDVRANPISRRYGFAQRTLKGIADKLGVTYCHFPELGVPSERRRGLGKHESYMSLLHHYETEILPRQAARLKELVDCLMKMPSALLCMEKDVTCCHRSRLAQAAGRISGLSVRHLS